MQTLSARLVIGALVTGSFGLGASEFLVMALLPEIARDIGSGMQAGDSEVLASTLASGYALGVAIGAFIVPRMLNRFSDSRTLLICAATILVFTLVVALSPTMMFALPARFLSALVHATYVGTASVVVSRILGRDGLGAAVVIGGLTTANLLAVPALTALGSHFSWRAGLLVAAALFLPTALMALCVPRVMDGGDAAITIDENPRGRVSAETLLLVAVLALLATAAAVTFSFIAPLTRELQGGEHVIPMFVTMAAFGIGMNIGNFVSGWQADRYPLRALWLWAAVGAVGCGVFLIADTTGAMTLLGTLFIGGGFGGITPSAQVLFMSQLVNRRRLAASLASAIVNFGIFTGTAAAGLGALVVGVLQLPTISLVVTALAVLVAVATHLALKQPVATRTAETMKEPH